jgi:copper chaperone
MSHTYEFNVTMSCGGCSGAIDRVLKKLDGVESYEVSLENQSAKVVTELPYEVVLEKIAKTGKKINSAKADGVDKPIEIAAAA